jgi:hypothetical protein
VTQRISKAGLVAKRLPVLRQAVRNIESTLTRYPELANSVEGVVSDYRRFAAVARVHHLPVEPKRARRPAIREERR